MRQARVGRFLGVAAALGSAFLGGACSSTDATPPRPVHGSIGQETFGVLCDRIGAQALTEDLTGASFRGVCHVDPATRAFADHVDESRLPRPIDDTEAARGALTRQRAIARIEALVRHRADLILALDTMFPASLRIPTRGGASGCAIDGERPLSEELASLLGRMTEAYDDGTVPQTTRALGRVMDAIKVSPEAQTALARLAAREGYRPANVALGVARPVMAYPRLRDLASATLRVLSPDADPFATAPLRGPDGARIPVAGPAYAQLRSMVEVAALEMRAAVAGPARLPPTRTPDPVTGIDLLSRPRTKLEVLSALASTEDAVFGTGIGGATGYVVRRDPRGLAQVTRSNGALAAPFVDTDGDGLADVDAFGQLVTGDGRISPSPFPTPDRATDTTARDPSGRPLAKDGAHLLYDYVDTRHTYAASILANAASFVAPDGARGVLTDALAGTYVVLGPRDGAPSSTRTYAATGGGPDVTVRYDAIRAEQSPVVDLVYALGQTLADPNADATLATAKWLMTDRESDVARLVAASLAIKTASDAHPEAVLPAQSMLWDELLDVLAKVAAVTDADGSPGLLEGLLTGIADEKAAGLGAILSTYAANRDELDYDRTDVNGPPINVTRGAKNGALATPVDRTKPDQGANRSELQRFLQLVHDTNGVEACNRPGAMVKARLDVPVIGAIDISIPDNALVRPFWGKSSFGECEVFHIQNMATFYMASIVGKAQYVLRDKQLRDGIEFNLGVTKIDAGISATTVHLLERSSDLTGHQPAGTTDPALRTGFWTDGTSRTLMTRPEWLNRNLFFPNGVGGDKPARAKAFSDALNPDHAGTAACPTRVVDDPLSKSDPNYVPGGKIRLPVCADGDWLDQRDPRTIFALETSGFYEAIAPVVKPFVDRDRADLLVELLDVLHRHWGDANVTASDCRLSGDPARPTCAKDGVVRYEPVLAEAFGGELLPALRSIVASMATSAAHAPQPWLACATRDTSTHACKGANVSGVRALAYAGKALLDPAASSARALTDRRGKKTITRNDGSVGPQVTPAYLVVDALVAMDRSFAAPTRTPEEAADRATRLAQWRRARAAIVDRFLSASPAGGGFRFDDTALPRIAPVMIDLLRQELRASCPEWPNATCAWAGQGIASKLADTVGGPLLAHGVDTLDAIRKDESARVELERILSYLLDAKSSSDALLSLLAASTDGAQLLQDETNLVPLLHALGAALGDDAAQPDQRNLVDATTALLTRLTARAVDDHGDEQCARELDPNQVLTPVLQASVTPVSFAPGRVLSPIEIILDTIADVNRAAPESDAPRSRDDYASITANVSDFLLNKERGMEQFYAIVKRATAH
jgi:hypothetical protein